MFREPSRHDKVLRNAAGDDAGDVGGCSTTGLLIQTGASIDCICGFFRRIVRAEVEWWMQRVRIGHRRTAPQPWASLPVPKWSHYRTGSINYV